MKVKLPLSLFLLFVTFLACNRDDDAPQVSTADETSTELLAILDAMPDASNTLPENILLPNGMTLRDYLEESDSSFAQVWLRGGDPYAGMSPSQARTEMIARISAAAWNLCNRELHKHEEEGPNKPKQYGLAYSWGSKDDTTRQASPVAGSYCTHQIFGLDCSGFLYQIFSAANIQIPKGPAALQSKPETIQTAFNNASPALQPIILKDLGPVATGTKLQTGDILYWKNSASDTITHIGIVLENTLGQKAVYQSIGRNRPKSGQCEDNLGLLSGPRGILFGDPSGQSIYKNCYLLRAEAPLLCGCASGSALCTLPPDEAQIRLGLAGFQYQPGPGTKAEAKAMMQYLCADIQHEYTYSDGTIRVCGVFPTGYEITFWSPSYGGSNLYGVRYGPIQANHSYFGSNDTYFDILKP